VTLRWNFLRYGFVVLMSVVCGLSPLFAQEGESKAPIESVKFLNQPTVSLTENEAISIKKAVERLIKEETNFIGSFEVGRPGTEDLLNFQLDRIGEDVLQIFDGEYLVHVFFLDEGDRSFETEIYISEYGDKQYEIMDVIVIGVEGKRLFEV